jgi:hypothetical protein
MNETTSYRVDSQDSVSDLGMKNFLCYHVQPGSEAQPIFPTNSLLGGRASEKCIWIYLHSMNPVWSFDTSQSVTVLLNKLQINS